MDLSCPGLIPICEETSDYGGSSRDSSKNEELMVIDGFCVFVTSIGGKGE
jgi:hypothetical protein